MAFVPNFSSSQSAGSLTTATFTDTSTGYSGTTGRLFYMRKYDGSYLVPSGVTVNYTYWPYQSGTGDELSINALDKDYCLDCTAVYYSGSTTQTSKTILTLFTGYADLFLRQLTQALSAGRVQITNKNFWYNKNKLRVLLDDAAQAVALLNDQTIAQFCLNEAKKLIDNPQSFW